MDMVHDKIILGVFKEITMKQKDALGLTKYFHIGRRIRNKDLVL